MGKNVHHIVFYAFYYSPKPELNMILAHGPAISLTNKTGQRRPRVLRI